jgi:MFS family permease
MTACFGYDTIALRMLESTNCACFFDKNIIFSRIFRHTDSQVPFSLFDGRFQFTLLAIFGLLVAGDGMEMVVISLLYPALRAQWGLSSTQEGMLASAVFAGLVLGNLLGGHLGDHAGRRFTILSAGLLFLIASAAASMAPDFISLCCFRAIVGLAVGAKVLWATFEP